ncbi:MAG: sulfotransferase [Hyphomicrobiales bacterium]|nr:sulfotransferase [Hyphomicrobiales bacterium]
MLTRNIIADQPALRPLKAVLRANTGSFKPQFINPFGLSDTAWPDFMVIGAQRAGTISLHNYLAQHPQLVTSTDKEVHFFDLNFDRGLKWYRRNFCRRGYLEGRARRTGMPQLTFETTPYYMHHPAVPARIDDHLPDTRFIVLLRNPIERAYSHYWNERHNNFETLSFEVAIDAEPQRLAGEADRLAENPGYYSYSHHHHSYIDRGKYDQQLDRWFNHFDKSRFLFVKAEDFFCDPAATLDKVTSFLTINPLRGVDFTPLNVGRQKSIVPDYLRKRLNEQFRPHNAGLAYMTGLDIDWM